MTSLLLSLLTSSSPPALAGQKDVELMLPLIDSPELLRAIESRAPGSDCQSVLKRARKDASKEEAPEAIFRALYGYEACESAWDG